MSQDVWLVAAARAAHGLDLEIFGKYLDLEENNVRLDCYPRKSILDEHHSFKTYFEGLLQDKVWNEHHVCI